MSVSEACEVDLLGETKNERCGAACSSHARGESSTLCFRPVGKSIDLAAMQRGIGNANQAS